MTILATLAYIIDSEDQVLMLHRNKKENDIHQGKYNGVGGKFAPNESPYQCLLREVKEETSLDILSAKFKGHLLFPKFDKQNRDWLVFVYIVDQFSGTLTTECPEGELIWIPRKNLLSLNLWEGDHLFIEELSKKNTFDGNFAYKDGKLINQQLQILTT